MNEAELVEQAQRGDGDAFATLVMAHQRFVYNLALRAVGNTQEAEDIAQEAFIRAWRALPAYRQQAQFRTWLYRIVINLTYDRRPRLRRELSELDMENAEFDPGAASPVTPIHETEDRELHRFIQKKVAALPDSYQMMVQLRFQQDFSYEEIADIMNIPLGTVKTGLFRARAQLRSALEQQPEAQEWIN